MYFVGAGNAATTKGRNPLRATEKADTISRQAKRVVATWGQGTARHQMVPDVHPKWMKNGVEEGLVEETPRCGVGEMIEGGFAWPGKGQAAHLLHSDQAEVIHNRIG